MAKTCTISSCIRPHVAKGLCMYHYNRTPEQKEYQRNKSKLKRLQNPDARRARQRELYALKPKRQAEAQLKYKYGLTQEQWNAKFGLQDHQCACCGTKDPVKSWCVDHAHSCCPGQRSCGKCLRGIVCHPCNTMLGMARDTIKKLEQGIAYLRRYDDKKSFVYIKCG